MLPAREPNGPLFDHQEVDVVVVGAGFTGIACAKRWAELAPDCRIAIVDASDIGEGNPGRNSGFLLDVALAEDADPANTKRMAQCNELTRNAMQTIVEDVARSGLAVDLGRAGTYRAAAGNVGMQALSNYQAFLKSADLPFRELDRAQLKDELGTDFYQAGLYSPDCYLAQPAAVIRALAATIPDSINIFERSPVVQINPVSKGWQVVAHQGSLTCTDLVLANNSFIAGLGVARPNLASVYTYAALTEPLSASALGSLGSVRNWGLLPTHRLGSTLRLTTDGRLLIRSLHDLEKEQDEHRVREALSTRLKRRFPQLGEFRFDYIWGGAVGFTYNGGLVWGGKQPGLWVSGGCNGGGTVKGTMLGRLLADKANGKTVPDVEALFGTATWMPPDPIRGLGFQLTSAWQSWQGRNEL